ncbi:unnamed protein product [Rhodiola kirilowii]
MGGSWSGNKRRNGYVQHPQPSAPSLPMTLPSPPPSSLHTSTPSDYASSNYAPNPNPPNHGFAPNPSYHHPMPAPAPPPPPPAYNMYSAPCYQAPAPYYGVTSIYSQCGYNGGGGYVPYYVNQYNGWIPYRPPLHGVVMHQAVAPPKFVNHQNAKKVKNYVNVRKDSVTIEVDEQNPDHFLVSFDFDAEHDGSITVHYFAKVEDDCNISTLLPEAHTPIKVSFQKGPGQRFQQTSETGIDLGFFELDDLAKPSTAEDMFPLVICAETSVPTDGQPDEHRPLKSPHMQITQAVLLKKETGFQVKVMKQILWIDEVRYELRNLFGIGSSSTAESSNDGIDAGKECVICLTEPKDTAVLPCRHMCMCSDCARALRLQSNKCPICRQPIDEIMEIKIENKGN